MTTTSFSQFAVMNIHYQYHPLDYFLDSMVRLGIQNIDFWAGYPHFLMSSATLTDAAKVRREIERRGLSLICCTPKQVGYPLNIAAEEAGVRSASVAYLQRSLELAAELGANLFQVVPGWGYYHEPSDDAWKRSREALGLISEKAGALGITVILEHLQIIESNLINSRFELRRMLDEVNSPHLKAVLDTCHMAVAGESVDDYFAELGERIVHIHFNESEQLPLGEGGLPLKEYLRQLESQGYKGLLTLEICSRKHYIDPEASLKMSLDTVKKPLA
ncbi:sugar phosphate isomerase/epimerase [Paenibacillus sp. P26]|nr:sugar phosphate isomerase/epimerase [Paenibacillus sp. P26]